MSLHGINNGAPLPGLGSLVRPETARTANDRNAGQGIPSHATDRAAAAQAGALARPALKPQTPIAGQAAAQHSVPSEAPAGTDPSLWSVLTTEERNFFAKTAAMGPLTYGRIKAVTNPVPPAARGVRLDVRA
ncbi:MAG: hypothetical protein V4617_02465 [Gemmatimonadota bacterium]